MIDKTKEFWTSDKAGDINEYLRLYSENENIEVKPIKCHVCGNDAFELNVDQNEDAIQIICSKCGKEKILLDCEEIWEEAEPEIQTCPICKTGRYFNVRVGFIRREGSLLGIKKGDVKWVYIANRCTTCGTLGSYLDWKVDYSPTKEMEKNI